MSELEAAMKNLAYAQDCVRENRGYDKEQAREALSCYLGEELVPALTRALENCDDDKKLIKIARLIWKTLNPGLPLPEADPTPWTETSNADQV